jgi:small-conductance mechanosensitive channel/CRP-like cAMP-binding protein
MPFLETDAFDWMLYRGKGLFAGLILLLLLLVFLTGPARRRIRWVLTLLVLHVALLWLRLPFPRDSAIRHSLHFLAVFLLFSALGQSVFLLLTQSRISQAVLRPFPQIFLDIVHSFVYVAAFLVALGDAGVSPAELFAGSALLTAVVGLSLRDTLGNLFAGLAIQAQRPFEVGDWIQFNKETSQIGQVVEINWRATKVLTPDKVEIIVPNALLGQAPIINYSRPDATVRRMVFVHVGYDVRPQRVREIILAALVDMPGVLANPPPTVVTNAFDDRGVQYSVRFFIADFATRSKLESAVRDRVWYALGRHGIDIPVPPRTVRVHKAGKRATARTQESRIAEQEEALGCVDFFDHLPGDVRRRLAGMAQTRLFAEQEVIIREGDTSTELFIIEAGAVVVTVNRPEEGPLELARMGAGNFFGEMAALTGEPRRATVRAIKECQVLVVGKAALAQVFESSPELAEHVSQTIALRQANLSTRLSEHTAPVPQTVAEHSHHLLKRIKEFFSI